MTEHLRLKQVRHHFRLSQGGLARSIGRKQGSISDIERGRNSADGILQLLKLTFGVDPHWLKTGEGEMLLPKSAPGKPGTAAAAGVPYFSTEVYDKPAGPNARTVPLVKEAPEYYIDFKPFNDCTAYFPYYGDSMYPKFQHGDIIAVKKVENPEIILWGEAYLIVTSRQANGLKTVRQLIAHKDKRKVILRALNPDFSGDIVIERETIVSLYLVKGKITAMV